MKKLSLILCSILLIFGIAGIANAAPVTFFGEDLGLGEGTALSSWANASAAESNFLSNLVGVGTEDFETYSDGTGTPLALTFPGAGTATLNGSGYVNTVTPGTTNGVGRYAISGSNYWEATSEFSLTFSAPIAAFGFYGIDIGDYDGQVTLHCTNGDTLDINIGNSMNISGGSVLYFGFYDLEHAYTSIEFGNTAEGVDFFGFDDFTIGTIEQVVPSQGVPEPATILLLGSGLIGLGVFGRKKLFKK